MTIHKNKEVQTRNDKPKKRKIALTEKIEDTEKQIIVSRGDKKSASLVEGKFVSYSFNNGFTVHGGNSHELVNSNIISTAPKSLIVTILLEGQLEFAYDNLSFNLDTDDNPNSNSNSNSNSNEHKGIAILVNLKKPANFRRSINQGNHVVKINLMMEPKWLREHLGKECDISSFLQQHKSHLKISVTNEMASLTKQILASETPTTFIEKIQLESLSYSLLVDLLQQLSPQLKAQQEMPPSFETEHHIKTDNKVEDMISFIESQLDHPLSLEQIAIRFSMSVSNLQRKFKQQFGLTVNSYIRYRRLEIAKQHLEQGLVSVTEAAYEAGYHHPANFTNAFKKTFGCTPTTYAKL
ncbi:AraC family transcriptional regulator [Vibrio lamellibrachiae]|uniref:helix-turn-helix domain-containing protein n=1 Tax=Vibrio lamellibrachiae TaxID=2910253 RepID=UPI003D112CE6